MWDNVKKHFKQLKEFENIAVMIGCLGVILDMIFTLNGTFKYGFSLEGNPVTRFILENYLYDHLILYFFEYILMITFCVRVVSRLSGKIKSSVWLEKAFVLIVAFMPYYGPLTWINSGWV